MNMGSPGTTMFHDVHGGVPMIAYDNRLFAHGITMKRELSMHDEPHYLMVQIHSEIYCVHNMTPYVVCPRYSLKPV